MNRGKKMTQSFMGRRKLEEVAEELINIIEEVETQLGSLSDKIFEIRDKYEIEYVIADIKKLSKKDKLKPISTSWLQRRYKLGYARSARYLDLLADRKIIKATDNSTAWKVRV